MPAFRIGNFPIRVEIVPRCQSRPFTSKEQEITTIPRHVLVQKTQSFVISKYRYLRKTKVFSIDEWDEQLRQFRSAKVPLEFMLEAFDDAKIHDCHDVLWWLLFSPRYKKIPGLFRIIFHRSERQAAVKMGIIYISKLAEVGSYGKMFHLFRAFAINRFFDDDLTSETFFSNLAGDLKLLINTDPKKAAEKLLQILFHVSAREDLIEKGIEIIKRSLDCGYRYPQHFFSDMVDALLHSNLPLESQMNYFIRITYLQDSLYLSPSTVDSLCRRLVMDKSLRLQNLAYNHLHRHKIPMPISFLHHLIRYNCMLLNSAIAWRIYAYLPRLPHISLTVKMLRALSMQHDLRNIQHLFEKDIVKRDLNNPNSKHLVYEIIRHAIRHNDSEILSHVSQYKNVPMSRRVQLLSLSSCLSFEKVEKWDDLVDLMREQGFELERRDYNVVLRILLKQDPEKAFRLAKDISNFLTVGSLHSLLDMAVQRNRPDIFNHFRKQLGDEGQKNIVLFNILLKPLSFVEAQEKVLNRGSDISYVTLRMLFHKAKKEKNHPGIRWTIVQMKRYGWTPSGGEASEWVRKHGENWKESLKNACSEKKNKLARGLWIHVNHEE